ncbi:hypothetical protein ACJIZ3_007596 [Penstemon smallii]|uniref:NLP1-9 GAF domain-containing protein n=1 Tax=Penstemon smallii TaxID=265156 RepID=A0ABD3T830_9LAMI
MIKDISPIESMENAEEYFADWTASDHLSATVFWKPYNREKIIQALGEIASRNRDACCLLQFWAHKVFDGRSYITNMDQPFAVGGERSVPAMTIQRYYYVGGEEKEKEEEEEEEDNTNVGPIGRVFRNGHPEISPHLYLYSGIKLDIVLSKHIWLCLCLMIYLEYIAALFGRVKAAKLRSTHTSISVPIHNVYVPCSQCPKSTICMKMKSSYFYEPPFEFMKASKFHGVQMGKVVAGISLESQNKLCFCESLSHFSIIDYPLAHFKKNSKSFKVASDRQLGEELVVKVIDFENFNFKVGQHDNTFPLKFEITRYGRTDNAAANLEKGIAAMESNRKGNKMKYAIQYEVPKPHSGKKLQDVLENLRVNKSTLKREIIDCGINNSWPSSKKIKKNPDAIFEAAANARKCAQGSSGGSRSPPRGDST